MSRRPVAPLPALLGPVLLAPVLLACTLALAPAMPAAAQEAAPAPAAQDRQPTEITATNGIEWRRAERTYIARGNARATQGDETVTADMLVAYYRETPEGKNHIYRMDAIGNVRIQRGTNTTATGEHGIYDVDNKVMTLTGGNLTATSGNGRLTARDSLEYWKERDMLVARGKAVAIQGRDDIRADVLVAHIGDVAANGRAKRDITRVDAFGNVVVTSQDNVARGSKGTYDVATRTAVLVGNPSVTRPAQSGSGGAGRSGQGGRAAALLVPNSSDGAQPAQPAAGGSEEPPRP